MKYIRAILLSVLATMSFSALAVPILQLGPDAADTSATYDVVDETWFFTDNNGSFTFNAYNLGDFGLTAYLVFTSSPKSTLSDGDMFDITVSDDNGALDLFSSGVNTPPATDPNTLAPHGIFESWNEVYTLVFDDSLVIVPDTQPGETGTANGYVELITVAINDAVIGNTIHVDLFTMDAAGQVTRFAPYSHDGSVNVPAPSSLVLFGLGLIVLGAVRRRHNLNH